MKLENLSLQSLLWLQLLPQAVPSCEKVAFIIIGVQKGGTTALRANLRLHPNIAMPKGEHHYFDNIPPNDPSLEAYVADLLQKIDPPCQRHQLLGDSKPSYIRSVTALLHIAEVLPDVKLIVCLRDPVERLFSQYRMKLYNPSSPRARLERGTSFEDWLAEMDDILPSLRRGMYVDQLRNVSALFPREHIHLICSEEVRETLDYNATFRFVGVPPMQLSFGHSRVGAGEEVMQNSTRKYLTELYDPWNRELIEWLEEGPREHHVGDATMYGAALRSYDQHKPVILGTALNQSHEFSCIHGLRGDVYLHDTTIAVKAAIAASNSKAAIHQ